MSHVCVPIANAIPSSQPTASAKARLARRRTGSRSRRRSLTGLFSSDREVPRSPLINEQDTAHKNAGCLHPQGALADGLDTLCGKPGIKFLIIRRKAGCNAHEHGARKTRHEHDSHKPKNGPAPEAQHFIQPPRHGQRAFLRPSMR